MSYVLREQFMEEIQSLGVEDKIHIIMVLLNSIRAVHSGIDDKEAMALFDHFTGSMNVDEGFDIKAEKNSYLDERYGV